MTRNNHQRPLTAAQSLLLSELHSHHRIEPDQVGFDGDDPTPIFDYTAISLLSLRLTDIKDIDCWISSRDLQEGRVTAKCVVILPDGRSRSVEGSAAIGEEFADDGLIDSWQLAESVAQSRASRLGIRSVGINLMHAHRNFKATGKPTTGHTDHDPRKPYYDEIHQLAENLQLIKGGEKSEYRLLLSSTFLGKESARDLDDAELQQFLTTLRALDRVRRSRGKLPVAV
jgi:hypothetical protein